MPPTTHGRTKTALLGKFEELVRYMPPQAILDEVHYDNTIEIIDRLLVIPKLTKGQELYMETLVQLVHVYETKHHPIDTSHISGLDSLRSILEDQGMGGSDLGRLLGVHRSHASKILKGERALTVDHLRILADRFKVSPALFM